MISTADSTSGRRENRKTVKVWIPLLVAAVLATCGLHGSIRSARGQSATVRADAIVLVNSTSAGYQDFAQFIQPYLDHSGVPYAGLLNFDNMLAQRTSVNVPVFSNSTAVSVHSSAWITTSDLLQYHYIVTDLSGKILPWYAPDNLGASYNHILHLVFEWWLAIEPIGGEPNLPYYVMHQIWQPGGHRYGLGGDQIAMAMSSWRLLYDYTGDDRTIDDMVLMADHVLASGLSSSGANWPYLPYPYQTSTYDVYDGDMIAGAGYLQPDKAGSFGCELLNLYKITADSDYLSAAINIANTLAGKTVDGDGSNSPLPFRVRASDGSVYAAYTTNFAGTLMLWEGLIALNQGNVSNYNTAHGKIITWLKANPVADDDWGPFFEDVSAYSDTQINAVTMAMYIMEHRTAWGSSWAEDARSAMDWVISELGNSNWSDYGVQVVNEQTAYRVAGQSHTSRQASMELRYAELTGDSTNVQNAIRQLNWATYMVDTDGKNYYPSNAIWLTDGYGDYVRHYLRAMAAAPSLAPDNQDHLLRTSSVIQSISYQAGRISFDTFDDHGQELVRVNTFVPLAVTADGVELPRLNSLSELDQQEGYTLGALGDLPSVLRIRHDHAQTIVVTGDSISASKSVTLANPVQLGQPVTYAITLSNASPSMTLAVTMTDSLPTALTFGGWVQQGGATQANGTIVWTGNINAQARLVVVFTATLANDPILYGQIITNTAYFQSANGTSRSASAAFAVPAPDLSHSVKLVSASTVKAGERVTYTILLSNTGSLSANVHYTDTLPTELEWLNGDLNGAVTVDAGKSVTRLILAQLKTQVGNSAVFYNTVDIDDGYHSILTRRSPPTAVSAFPIYLPLVMHSQNSIGSSTIQDALQTQTPRSCIH